MLRTSVLRHAGMLLWYMVAAIVLSLWFFARAEAAINPQITFYGTLQNSSSTNLTGTYDMVFNFYNTPTGGVAIDTSTHTAGNGNPVSVINGEFVVLLGSGIGNTLDGVDFNNSTIYIGLSVEGDGEMTPRQRFTAAPYAFNSDTVDGIEANEFLRYNSTNTITAADAATLFTITQNGAGDIFNVFDGGTEVFSILDGGNIGVGTTSPAYDLTVGGDLMVSGALYDNSHSAGAVGSILQSDGSGLNWVSASTLGLGDGTIGGLADVDDTNSSYGTLLMYTGASWATTSTSSLGLGDGSFLGQSDTPSAFGAERLIFTNSGGTALTDSAMLVFDGTNLGIGISNPNEELHVAASNGDGIRIEGGAPTLRLLENDTVDANYQIRLADGNLLFQTNNDAFNSASTRAMIDSSGNFGIGTTTPVSKLSIYDSSNSGLTIGRAGVPIERLFFNYNGPTANVGVTNDDALEFSVDSIALLTLQGNAGAGQYNVGVATSTPFAKFTVEGDIMTTGALYDNSYSPGTNGMVLQTSGVGFNWVATSSLGINLSGTEGYTITFDATNTQVATSTVYIADDRNVGIGTTNPLDKLHVAGNILINNTQSIRGRNNSGTANTLLAYDSSNDLQIGSGIGSDLMLNGNTSQQFLVGGSEFMRLDANGNLGIGDISPDFKLEVVGTTTDGYFGISDTPNGDGDIFVINLNGNVGIGTTTLARELTVAGDIRVGANTGLGCIEDYDGTLIGGTCSSDEALKENIIPLSEAIDTDVLAGLVALTPVTYNWNAVAAENWLKNTHVTNTGLIAQDVEAQFPELVVEKDGIKQVKFTNFTFYIIEAIKEMWQVVSGNQDKISELEERIEELEAELDVKYTPPPALSPEPEDDPEEEQNNDDQPEDTSASSTDPTEGVDEDTPLEEDTEENIEETEVVVDEEASSDEPALQDTPQEVETPETPIEPEVIEPSEEHDT